MKTGFTLLEISIVIVIIGLIAGGILAGSTLIRVAQVRSQISELQKYDTAIAAFKLKYNAIPGDLPNPSDFGLPGAMARCATWAGTCVDGNGNSVLDDGNGNYPPTTIGWESEYYYFFIQLSAANLINAKYEWASNHYMVGEQFPKLKISDSNRGIYPFTRTSGKLAYFLGVIPFAATPTTSHFGYAGEGAISPVDANSIDSKIDDGVANRGRVFSASTPDVIDVNYNYCINADGSAYVITGTNSELPICKLTVTSASH